MIVAAVGLRREARVLATPGVAFVVGGGDATRLETALEAEAPRATGFVSIGICGALAPGLRPGHWVVASAIVDGDAVLAADEDWAGRLAAALGGAGAENAGITGLIVGSDAIVGDAAEKRALHARTGAVAVDMESHVVARVARRRGLPFAAARVVSDGADQSLPHAARVGMRADGSADLPAVLRSLLRAPGQLPVLLRVAWDAERAFRSLVRGGRRLGPHLGQGFAGDGHAG